MPSVVGFNFLCPPAYIYLVVSTVWFILFVIFLNNGTLNMNDYCMDTECSKPSIAFMILFKAMFIIFWTWVLNFICRSGYPGVSWFLFLFPFIIMILAFLIIYQLVLQKT